MNLIANERPSRSIFKTQSESGGLTYKAAHKYLNGRKFEILDPSLPNLNWNIPDYLLILGSILYGAVFLSFLPFGTDGKPAPQPFIAQKLPICMTFNNSNRWCVCEGPTRISGFGVGYIFLYGVVICSFLGIHRKWQACQNRKKEGENLKIDLLIEKLMPLGSMKELLQPEEAALIFSLLKSEDKKLLKKFNFKQLEACRRVHPSLFAGYLKTDFFNESQQLEWRLIHRIDLAKDDQKALLEIFQWEQNVEAFTFNAKLLEHSIKIIGPNGDKKIFNEFAKILHNHLLANEVSKVFTKKDCKKVINQIASSTIGLEQAIEQKIYPQTDFYFSSYLFSIPSYLESHLASLVKGINQKQLEELGKSQVEQYISFLKEEKAPFVQWYDLLKIACILNDKVSVQRLEKALSLQMTKFSKSYDLYSVIEELNDFPLPILKGKIDEYFASMKGEYQVYSKLIFDCQFAKKYQLKAFLDSIFHDFSNAIELLSEQNDPESFFKSLEAHYKILVEAEWEANLEPKFDEQLEKWLTLHPQRIDTLYFLADEEGTIWLKNKIRYVLKDHEHLLNFSAIPSELMGLIIHNTDL